MSEDRRRQLVEAAHQVLLHYGPRKTTIHDIAHAAGVAVGSVYLEFSSKAALLAAVYARQLERAEAAVEAAMAHPALADAIRAAFDARTRVYWAMGRGGAHAQEIARPFCASVHAVWRQHGERVREILKSRLAHLPDPHRTASALMNAYTAFEPGRFGEVDFAVVQRALDGLHELVLAGFEGERR